MKQYVVNEKVLYYNDEEYNELVLDIVDVVEEDGSIVCEDIIEGEVYSCGTYDRLLDEDEDFFPEEVDFLDSYYFDTLEEAKEYLNELKNSFVVAK